MKAVLEYTDRLVSHDGRQVFKILAERNIEIIKTKPDSLSNKVRVTIRVKDYEELNLLLLELNKYCRVSVCLIKVRREGIFGRRNRKDMS